MASYYLMYLRSAREEGRWDNAVRVSYCSGRDYYFLSEVSESKDGKDRPKRVYGKYHDTTVSISIDISLQGK